MATHNAPTFVCVGGIFIDDIVYPDGRTSMEILGGGGVHTAAGMQAWDERPGLVACQGTGIPESAVTRLAQGFDLQGIVPLNIPQARAWQLFEWDGKRTEIYRVDEIGPYMDRPKPDEMPGVYREAKAAAILRDGQEFRRWRDVFPDAVVLWEPEQAYMIPQNSGEFRAALPFTDIVSPNLLEASLVYGTSDPHTLVDTILNDGATIAALRMGDKGSLVGMGQERYTFPAVPVPTIIDQTGAGNTFCGAFLVGWYRTRDLCTAGCYGAVAASFALETVGVLTTPAAEVRQARYEWVVRNLTRA